MKSILLLGGGGRIGSAIALKLYKDFHITLVDLKQPEDCVFDLIGSDVQFIKMDIENHERLFYLTQDYDLIVNALPSYYYNYVLDLAVGCRKPIYITAQGKEYNLINNSNNYMEFFCQMEGKE